MEPEGSLPHSQQPATCPYLTSDQSSPCPHPTPWRSISILSSHLCIGLSSGFFPSSLPTKTLSCSVYIVPNGRWMNECGALVEWYWQGKTEVLGEKHYTALVVDVWMSMEHWWNDTDRGNWSTGRKTLYSVGGRCMNEYGALVEWYWQGKLKYWEKNIVQPHNTTLRILGALLTT
jgi:hypothetical protein